MSHCNVHLAPARALIATDTLAISTSTCPAAFTSKIAQLPHLGAVAVDLGSTYVSWSLRDWANRTFFRGGFDDLVMAAPNVLCRLHSEFIDEFGEVLDDEHGHRGHATALFGWSARERRVVGFAFNNEHEFTPVRFNDGVSLYPDIPAQSEDHRCRAAIAKARADRHLSKFSDPETFIAAARIQQEFLEQVLGYTIGGELLVTEVRRRAIATRIVWRFPDYEKSLALMEGDQAPIAEAEEMEEAVA